MMTKLTQVQKVLQENLDITIVDRSEKNYLPGRCGYFSHTMDFYVAPKTDGVYTAENLQTLMMSLVPGLNPTSKDDFHEERNGHMNFGKLYFDEEFGTEAVRREITLTDEDMFASDGFVNGKRVIEHTDRVRRRTWVRLFPNVQIATDALKGKNEFGIPKSELEEHQEILT